MQLIFTDNSASETGFRIQRSTDNNFVNPTPTTITVGPSVTTNKAGEGTDWGSTIAVTDTPGAGTFYYRVQAVDDGWKGPMSQSHNESVLGSSNTCGAPSPGAPVALGNCPLLSGFSNTAQVGFIGRPHAQPPDRPRAPGRPTPRSTARHSETSRHRAALCRRSTSQRQIAAPLPRQSRRRHQLAGPLRPSHSCSFSSFPCTFINDTNIISALPNSKGLCAS